MNACVSAPDYSCDENHSSAFQLFIAADVTLAINKTDMHSLSNTVFHKLKEKQSNALSLL